MSILIVGDSFSGPDNAYTVWPTLIGQRLNKQVINHASGGTGYVARGSGSPNRFSRQVLANSDLVPAAVEAVVIFGSVNDRYGVTDLYAATVFDTHRAIQTTYPQAKMLVVLPQWAGAQTKPAEIDRMVAIVDDQMWGYDWKYPYLNPSPGVNYASWWLPPSRPDLLGPDGFHPNQAGHKVIADKIEPHLRTLLGL